MRKGYISLFWCDFACIWLIYAFRENLRVLSAKIAFWENLEKCRGSRKPGAPRIRQHTQNGRRHGLAWRRTAVHLNTSTTSQPEMWHGLAVLGGTTVPPGTTTLVRRGLSLFRDCFFGELFHFHSFFFLSSYFRVLERGLRESSKLRLSLSIYAFGLTIYQDSTIVLPSASIYTSLFFSLLLFNSCSRFLCVFQWLSNSILWFVFLIWL